jgi:hypothetical protein
MDMARRRLERREKARNKMARPPGLLLQFAVTALLLTTGMPSARAASSAIQLDVPAILPIEAGGETAFPIRMSPGGSLPNNAFVLVHGLPASVILSAGQVFESGWGLKLGELPQLKILAAGNASGRSELTISVTTLAGRKLAEVKSSLFVRPSVVTNSTVALNPAAEQTEKTAHIAGNAPLFPAEDSASSKSADEPPIFSQDIKNVTVLMKHGDDSLKTGRINIARLFYRRAAELGWPDGAVGLAGTYDPLELQKLNAPGIEPDKELAEKWYLQAVALGSEKALERLQMLMQR